MANATDRVELEPTPNPDPENGPERFCRGCGVLVATETSRVGNVSFCEPTEAYGGQWGPWFYCKTDLPAPARAHQAVPIR